MIDPTKTKAALKELARAVDGDDEGDHMLLASERSEARRHLRDLEAIFIRAAWRKPQIPLKLFAS